MTDVVYVHGIGNKRPADTLRRDWDQALFGGDLQGRSAMAYWADLRYPRPLPEGMEVTGDRGEAPSLLVGGTAQGGLRWSEAEPVDRFVQSVLVDSAPGAEVAPAPSSGDARALAELARRMTYTADALARGESASSGSVQEVFPGPRVIRQAVFRALVRTTLEDVHAYFFGGQGGQIQDRLRAVLQQVSGPVVVVAHSLGSVIAYDVLRSWRGPALDVPLLVTIGSPLATAEIQDLVVRPLEVPAGVRRWVNACDARDIVALDATVRGEFVPEERVLDYLVANNSENHHGAGEYLRTPVVQQAVHSALEG